MSKTEVIQMNKAGERVEPGSLHTLNAEWEAIATTVSAGDEPTDLAVTERTYQTVKAAQIAATGGDEKISIFDIPSGWNGMRLRAEGITDNGTYTNQVYFGTLGDGNRDVDYTSDSAFDCELSYAGQLAWVVGTQASITSGYEMADAVTVTAGEWTKDWTSKSPGSERVAEARIDLIGADLIVIVPTAASADSKLLAKGF